MKMKLLVMSLLAASTLVACQAEQGDEAGNNYEGVQNTTFERQADDMTYQDGDRANKYDKDRGMVHNTNYQVADEAANRIEKIEGIHQAYVLKTRDNAYVAAVMDQKNNKDNVSNDMEKKITKAVKSVDQDINNVYVSTNPDFVDLTNNYVNDVEKGDPVEGFFKEFGQMVDRVFPEVNER